MECVMRVRGIGITLAAMALAPSVYAVETVRLRRGLVVPVRFEQELSLRQNRPGDRFSAVVERDRDLPSGTVFEGEIVDMDRQRGDRAGFMQLEFLSMILPDGQRVPIQALPIRMDDRSIRRGSDGRFEAKKKLEDSGKHIIGGMIGGYILGRIMGNRRGDGIIFGALAGIVIAEAHRGEAAQEIVVKRDAHMGALFEREVQFDFDYRGDYRRNPRSNDPYSRDDRYPPDRRDDRYPPDPRDERNRPDPRDDRYNPRYDPRDERKDPRYDRAPVIEYNRRELRFAQDEQPYREGNVWMVPLSATAEQMGFQVDGNGDSRRIYVEDDENVLVFELGSKTCRLNGRRVELPIALTVRNERVFVPIDAFSAAKSGQISINGTRIEK